MASRTLVEHEYARIYLEAIDRYLRTSPQRPLRLLEFGCGGGMNITRLVSLLEGKGIPVERAYGTDFSPRLVEAAEMESKNLLSPKLAGKLSFYVARNEQLLQESGHGDRRRQGSCWFIRPYHRC